MELWGWKVFGDVENGRWLKCWKVNYETSISFLSMRDGEMKRSWKGGVYWNWLEGKLLMMVWYVEMEE